MTHTADVTLTNNTIGASPAGVPVWPAGFAPRAPRGLGERAAGDIEILRDRWGVPNVFADTDEDAMFGLGYACAEDRAFQMYRNIRIMQGRFAELVGDVTAEGGRLGPVNSVTQDREMRIFGFARSAREVASNLDRETLDLLQAYSAGVNRFLATRREETIDLFATYSLDPEPWTPAHCILAVWYAGRFFVDDGLSDLQRGHQLESDREEAARARKRKADQSRATDFGASVLREDVSDEWLARAREFALGKGLVPLAGPASEGAKFSHAWVVGGKRSTTGSSTLLSDPQVTVLSPSLFYHSHVCGETFNVRGMGVPGSPWLLSGFNAHVAWGPTALGVDQADLFRLVVAPDRPDQYRLDGEWVPMTVRTETIRVRGSDPVELQVWGTVFGPVVTDLVRSEPAPGSTSDSEQAIGCPVTPGFSGATGSTIAVAAKRVPLCETDRETIQATFRMYRARTAGDLDAALSDWRFPPVNLVIGDRDGRTGYRAACAVPVRSAEAPFGGATVQNGSSRRFDWQGFVPHDLMPHCMDAERGFAYSANQRAIGSFYPIPVGFTLGGVGDRGWQLLGALEARESFAPEDVLDIHSDTSRRSRTELLRLAFRLQATEPGKLSPDARRALEHLDDWYAQGARHDTDRPGTALAHWIQVKLGRDAPDLAARYGGDGTAVTAWLSAVSERERQAGDLVLRAAEAALIDLVLARAWQDAARAYGEDPDAWLRRHVRSAASPVGYGSGLEGFPSLDPARDMLPPKLSCVEPVTLFRQSTQAYTQWVPLHDPDRAQAILPPGQSENPENPHWRSTYGLWSEGELHPAPLSRDAVARITHTQRMLRPR